jgi:hypothetical protein
VLKPRASQQTLVLRHSLRPYVAFALPLLVVTGIGAIASAKSGQWTSLWYVVVVWVFFLLWSFFLTRYQIAWNHEAITQKAAGGPGVTIDIGAITKVRLETSGAATLLSFRRPFRRISIYANDHKFIDVSLIHFLAEDIHALMRFVHEQRPDIALPKNWL